MKSKINVASRVVKEKKRMKIEKAQSDKFDIVQQITHKTIAEIYPRYYPKCAVDFFLAHHNDENIMRDIHAGIVYLIFEEDKAIGTVSIKENEICRLFVLPEYQHKGFGRELLDFSEKLIAENYTEIYLASSLPAKNTYLKRGYVTIEAHKIVTENGDVLCYDWMKKNSNYKNQKINYDGKKFVPKKNTDNGEVGEETLFHYHQKENIIWAEYSGGEIKQGFLVGTVDSNGKLAFTYQHINQINQLRIGECNSFPVFLEDDKIEMHEEWQWLNGDKSKGASIIVEV